MNRIRQHAILILGVILLGLGAFLSGWQPFNTSSNRLVVYCAHDAEFAEPILRDFERQTGITVHIRFDTEATKSLGLINLLQQEKSKPRCDVFWNNELLGMIELQEQGLLEPYLSSERLRIPERFRDPKGYWTGFAARMRVHILHESDDDRIVVRTVEESAPPGISWTQFRIDSYWENELPRVAIAKPLYGTTLTHYTVLADLWGIERLKMWHTQQVANGLNIVNGNATVKNLVAQGTLMTGWTDTDDVFSAQRESSSVRMIPVQVEGQQTICIPNCVGIIHGTGQRQAARKLVDFLISKETELKLAHSTAGQIPLGEVQDEELPVPVRELKSWARKGYDLRPLLPVRREVIQWLSDVYLNGSNRSSGQRNGPLKLTPSP